MALLLRGFARIRSSSFSLHFNEDKIKISGNFHPKGFRTFVSLKNPILWSSDLNSFKFISINSFIRPFSFSACKCEKKVESSGTNLADELLASKVNDKSSTVEEDTAKEEEEKKRTLRALKFTFWALGVMFASLGGFIISQYGAPLRDPNGEIIMDEFSDLPTIKQYYYRTMNEASNMNKMIKDPTSTELLPDPVKPPYIQPPYTLILELKDVLVHPEWTYQTGWRFKKRPGVDFLLQHCAPPLFEIVLYTCEGGFTALPVVEQLDPNGFIWYRLFKDATRYVDGKHLKDLYCVNRDLNKVIMVDWDREAVTAPRNQLCIPRWNGDMKDQTLVDLALMLRTMAESQVSDVREVLDYYRQYDDPIGAFVDNNRIAQEQEKELMKQREEEIKTRGFTPSFAGSFLRRK